MKNVKLKLAVLGAFGVLSAQALATGLVSLPSAGFTVSGGTSAYTLCNTTGGFGSGVATDPTTGANNTCAVFPANINTSPVSGFTLVSGTSVTRNVTDPAATGATAQVVAFLDERVFRNAGNTECIYAKRLRMNDSAAVTYDYNPGNPDASYIEVNDVALGGFSATTTPQAGYYFQAGLNPADSVVYRIGRAYTSVQHKNIGVSPFTPLSGYLTQPLTSPAPAASTEINGPGQPGASATAAQQTAAIRTNWVDFTLDITGGLDEDADPGETPEKNSSMLYVRAACTSAAPVALANSVKIRQTGQESQPFVTISTTGFVRSGANASF